RRRQEAGALDELRADERVREELALLDGRDRCRRAQEPVAEADLADVVKERPGLDGLELVAAEAETLGERAGQPGDAARVARDLGIAELEGAEEERAPPAPLLDGRRLGLGRERQRELRLLARELGELGGAPHHAAQLVERPGLDEDVVDVG